MMTETNVPSTARAVLIGVSAYEHTEFPPIPAARNSLLAMQALLSEPALCAWPPGQITVIANPTSAAELASNLTDVAESVSGVFLLYYVGHGVLSTRGELCLAVSTTRPDRPKISGLVWDTVADVMRVCPASVRIAILDCCFAGQAIEVLSGDTSSGIADIAHIDGVYTLTATTRNRTAHVPPHDLQDTVCTSFTGELRDLIYSGIPDGPAQLTFGDLYPVLRQRLQAKGLPIPSQRGTNTAHQFPFTANATCVGQEVSKGSISKPMTDSVPGDGFRVSRLLGNAERVARTITDKSGRASSLAKIAKALAISNRMRANELIDEAERLARSIHIDRSISGSWSRDSALADTAAALTAFDPARAAQVAQLITDHDLRLADIAEALAAFDPARAEHVARSIAGEETRASALAKVAKVLAVSDMGRADGLIDEAERLVQSQLGPRMTVWILTGIAKELATFNPGRAAELLADAERSALSIRYAANRMAEELASVGEALAAVDPGRAAELIAAAERIAQSIDDRWRKATKLAKAEALAHVVKAWAVCDPDRAERLACSIKDRWALGLDKAWALEHVVEAVASSDPDRAERIARSMTDRLGRHSNSALAHVAKALAASDPDRAERIALSIDRLESKVSALAGIAEIRSSLSARRSKY